MRGYKSPFAILAELSDEEEEEYEEDAEHEEDTEEETEYEDNEEEMPEEAVTEEEEREKMLESAAAREWGILSDGENQGVRHFYDYHEEQPKRIPTLALRLGISPDLFDNTLDGFVNFTQQALRVVREALDEGSYIEADRDRIIYYLNGTRPDTGVIVIVQHEKLQTMMPSDLESYEKMKQR